MSVAEPRITRLSNPYLRLMRLDRPVGTLLLLWPTLAALVMATGGIPAWDLIVVFTVGTFLMRSAGCVINDYADRDFDPHVARTRGRPLAAGELTVLQALTTCAALLIAAALLLPFLNIYTRYLAIGGVVIAATYPFMKRWTYLPQVILGAAFSWGILMAFTAVHGVLSKEAWLAFIASLFWIVAYDTQYAMADRDEDIQIGVKSTAILFGRADRFMIGLLQAVMLWSLYLLGKQLEYGWVFGLGLTAMAALFVYQQRIIRRREPAACLKAFRNNIIVGFIWLLAVLLEVLLFPGVANP